MELMCEFQIDKQLIVATLRELGILPDDVVALHSDIPSLGKIMVRIHTAGGPMAVEKAVNDIIDAFIEAVGGQHGLLAVPTFSYCFAGKPDPEVYDPNTTHSKVGLLTEVFFHRPDAKRSNQPTHSVAAIGNRAEQLVRDHDQTTPIGVDSPFHRLAQWGGWVCFLGTTGKTFSMLHLAEVLADVPFRDTFCFGYEGWKKAALRKREDGSTETLELREIPGCSRNFGKFDEMLENAGLTRKGTIYRSKVALFRANDAIDLAVQKLTEDPFQFLCEEETCQACDIRRSTSHFD